MYNLDATTQTIVGAWSFSTPFGVLSSNHTGASAFLEGLGMETNGSIFEEFTPTFFELVWLQFPITNTQQIGAVIATPPPGFNQISTACQNSVIIAGGCIEDYEVTGATTLTGIAGAPEPSGSAFFAVGMLGLVVLSQRKSLLCTRGLRLCRSAFGRG